MLGISELVQPRLLLIILTVSLLANMFLAFRVFDTALSLDHARAESAALRTRAAQALAVIRQMAARASRDEIFELGPELSKHGIVVKVQPNELQVGDVVFTFTSERRASVGYSE